VAGLTRRVGVLAGLAAGGLLLAACGGVNGHAVAACHQVEKAISTYHHAQRLEGAAHDAAIRHAIAQLDTALGDAATATSEDGSWNALMTTIGEAARVPIGDLVPSLTAQCADVLAKNPYAPQ
jgi:hypothetical protein